MLDAVYPLADGSGRGMRVRGVGFDSMGAPGVTEQAYAAWLRYRRSNRAVKLGLTEGRDVWNLVPTRGTPTRYAPRIQLVYPNTQRKDRKAASRGQVPSLQFNPNMGKDALAAQLLLEAPAAGAVSFPYDLREEKPPHEFFEQLAAEQRDPVSGAWSKRESNGRNEVMDMMVGCEVVARLHGLHRIDWERPPVWAAPWETNSMVVMMEAVEAAADAVPVLPAAVVVAARRPSEGIGRRLARMMG
jgi:phage terminase large subunit GpA-like protein